MTAPSSRQPASSDRLGALLEGLDVQPFRKEVLRQRWLDQVGWMGRQARKMRRRYLLIRIPVVLGGVAIPGLIAILLSAGGNEQTFLPGVSTEAVRIVSFFVSLGVAALAAYEEVMHFGDRWRHYRRTAELLKTLGWQYLTLSGQFKRFRSHDDAFTGFTERVEDVLNEDVEGYLSAVTVEGSEKRQDIVV
jgi:Protein of unknown function (DUF4231)